MLSGELYDPLDSELESVFAAGNPCRVVRPVTG